MSIITTRTPSDLTHRVNASVLDTLTGHLAMDRAAVTGCLAGVGSDLPIASRVAIVVIARVQKVFGISDLVDPKRLRPEQVTSVRSVAELLITKLEERVG